MNIIIPFFLVFFFYQISLFTQDKKIIIGADRLQQYLPLLKNKRVALFVNHTSLIHREDNTFIHLIDTLLKKDIHIVKIFTPEHGLSGKIQNGIYLEDEYYLGNIKVIPTYNLSHNHKISPTHLTDIDIIVFDIQDVGARFYTYISSLENILSASIENNIDFILLDRPNPNIDYVDGPVLNLRYKSFVGMQPIPVVYGMTIGEYSNMLIKEKWLDLNRARIQKSKWRKLKFLHYLKWRIENPQFYIITCKNYTRQTPYSPPTPPSPNLKNIHAIRLYPSLCFFEGTVISVGRGTTFPFECFGSPLFPDTLFTFYVDKKGRKKKYYGIDLRKYAINKNNNKLELSFLLNAYHLYPKKNKFFNNPKFFDKLVGNKTLREQIISRKSIYEIRQSWQEDIRKFLLIRKKYLIYKNN